MQGRIASLAAVKRVADRDSDDGTSVAPSSPERSISSDRQSGVKRRKVDVMTTLLEKLVSQNAEAETRKLEAEERRERLQQEFMLAIIRELRHPTSRAP